MRTWQRVGLVLVCAVSVLTLVGRAVAETITVTIGVGDTVLTVSGKTSPNAFVTISSDGSVIGTTLAASDGTYSKTFPAQSPGIHSLDVYGHSSGAQNTDTVSLNVNITEHATTTVDIFLPTTLVVEDTTLAHDQSLNLSGETYPSGTVKVFINNTEFVSTPANAQGIWSVAIDASSLAAGDHEFFVRVIDGIGNQSYSTALRFFSREAPPDTSGGSPPGSGIVAPPVPIITFPTPGTVWEKPEITITGKAQPGTQVELWDGTNPLGSVWSDDDGNWSILLSLQAKEYRLRARACLAGKCSAFSETILFTYKPGGLLSPLQEPLLISMPQLAYCIFEGDILTIRPTILNGQPPYETTTEWGDKVASSDTHAEGELTLSHAYLKQGKYSATLFAQDAQGRKGSIQFTVEVRPRQNGSWLPIIFWLLFILFALLLAVNFSRTKASKQKGKKS